MLFSIVIPLYNKETSFRECLDSIVAQDFNEFELIVIDDGSTDDSVKILDEYDFSNLKLLRQVNSGVSVARNLGIINSTAKYIIFLDADDYFSPYRLSILRDFIVNNNYPPIIGGNHYIKQHSVLKPVGSKSEASSFIFISEPLRCLNKVFTFLNSSTACVRRDLFESCKFPVGYRRGEDIYVWLELLADNHFFYHTESLVTVNRDDLFRSAHLELDTIPGYFFELAHLLKTQKNFFNRAGIYYFFVLSLLKTYIFQRLIGSRLFEPVLISFLKSERMTFTKLFFRFFTILPNNLFSVFKKRVL